MAREMTEAQIRALRFIAKRDWPAGEPRSNWIHASTYRVLRCKGLVSERAETLRKDCFGQDDFIVDLTPAALAKDGEGSDV